jgi:hypothetical protein
LGGRATFTVDVGPYVRECLVAVRGNLGEGFDHLCDIKTVDVHSYPVLGWIVTLRPSPKREERGVLFVNARPVILVQHAEGRGVEVHAGLGFASVADRLNVETLLDVVDVDERVVGVLPAWPGTYYVTGSVNGVTFSLGVHVNPDNERLVERLLKAYLDWLKGPEARKLKGKLAKPKPENQT